MKSTLRHSLLAACAATGFLCPGKLRAQDQTQAQPQAPIPVVIQPTITQYRVIDISQIAVAPRESPAAMLEGMLNQMAAQGWKLVTVSGSIIIMSR